MTQPNELVETIEKALERSSHHDFKKVDNVNHCVYVVCSNAPEWLRALLEERKTHAPHGRNYTNEQYVNLRNQLDQLREETGMVNALTDADNLDLRTQLQQTREEAERKQEALDALYQDREKWRDDYGLLFIELEQVKAELSIIESHLRVSNSQISDQLTINQALRDQLSAKDKVLGWYKDEGIYDQNEDALVPEILDDRGKKVRTIISHYKGEDKN